MATQVQRAKLLAVACPWCKAAVGEECSTGPVGKRRPITTLDGNAHDARWQAALGESARVMLPEVESRVSVTPEPVSAGTREPVSVGAAVGAAMPERPW